MNDDFDDITKTSFSQLEQAVGQDAYNTRIELERAQIEATNSMKRRHDTVSAMFAVCILLLVPFAVLGWIKFAMWVF